MTKEAIEQLCQKWIAEERKLRTQSQRWNNAGRWIARADTLSKCRRELQECAGLVVKPEDVM